jgi:methionyl-tRNA formyltransferase
LRVLFYGTPAFALPTLSALLVRHDVVAVVTQPDRPAGRGQRLSTPAVKDAALRARLPVLQPTRLRDEGWDERLRSLTPDVAVVVAFGQILPAATLAVPTRGSVNVHASLLPRYRGAAPVAWAVINGEAETGVTTFQMDAGMDSGPILLQRAVGIGPEETAGELLGRLAGLGAELLIETLDRLDSLLPRPQDHGAATRAPRLRKEDGVLDWTRPASELAARVRGLNPWPGAFVPSTGPDHGRLTIWRATSLPGNGPPGHLVETGRALAIGTGAGLLLPLEVQLANRAVMSWQSFLRGARLAPGASLGGAVAAP